MIIVEVIKFEDVFNQYFIDHTRKFNFFTVHITLAPFESKVIFNHEINVSN